MLILSIVLIAALVAEDQFIKLYVIQNFEECRGAIRSYYTFKIGDFKVFSLTHIRNDGAGWSILGGQTVFLAVTTAVIIIAILAYMIIRRRNVTKPEWISLSLIVAGGLGNLIDRCRMLIEGTDAFSGVVDYIKLDFINYPVFNFADCCVVVGAILFCIVILFGESKSKKAKKAEKADEAPTEEADNEQI